MNERKKNRRIKKSLFGFLLIVFLSSCQTNGSSFLDGYEPSDGFKNDWDSIKAFNRWIDPNVGAFLLMEDTYIDPDKFELEKEYLIEKKPSVRTYRSKAFLDLSIVTSAFLPEIFDYYDLDAPNRYVTTISWQKSDLTFLGCRYSDGAQTFAKSFAERQRELPLGRNSAFRNARFSWYHDIGDIAVLYYYCMSATTKPIGRNDPETRNLFEVTATWSETGFTIKAYNGSLARGLVPLSQ